MKFKNKLKDLFHVAVIVIIAFAAHWPVLVSNEVPFVGNSVESSPWHEGSGTGEPDILNLRHYPWFAFLHDSAERGDCPLWNPYEGCGIPFFAMWRTRCLSLFSLPFYLFPPVLAIKVSVLLKMVIAGCCAYYAALRLGFKRSFALVVSVSFELSGHVMLLGGTAVSDVVPWIPLLLVYVERLVIGQYRYWPVGSLIIALMLLGGEPEAVACALAFAALFIIIRTISCRQDRHVKLKTMSVFLSSVLLAIALAAVQIIPFIEFAGQASSMPKPVQLPSLRPTDAAVFFAPPRGLNTLNEHQSAGLLYPGVIQILLLPLWFAVRNFVVPRQRQRIEALLGVFIVFSLLALFQGVIGPQHLVVANSIALAVVAAAAAEEWVELNAQQCKTAILRFMFAFIGIAIVAASLIVLRASYGGGGDFSMSIGALVVFSLLFLSFIVATVLRPSSLFLGYSLVVLIVADLLLTFQPAIPYVPSEDVFPRTESVDALRALDGRIATGPSMDKWALSASLISQTHTTANVKLKRYDSFFGAVEDDPALLRRCSIAGVVLDASDIRASFMPLRPVLELVEVFPFGCAVFEDPQSLPRARMVYDNRSVDVFEPESLDSELPPIVEKAVPAKSSVKKPALASIARPERNTRVSVLIEDTPAGLLVLADAAYPGWKATVDGQPTQVLTVDGLFRGVEVGEGQHEVVFYYEPLSVKIGLIVSAAAGLVVLAGLFFTFRSSKSRG